MRQVYSKINHPLRCCQEQHRVNPEHVTPPVSCRGAVSCDHSGAIRAALAAFGSLTGMENPWHSGGCLGSGGRVQPQNSHQLSRWGQGARCGAVPQHGAGRAADQGNTRAEHLCPSPCVQEMLLAPSSPRVRQCREGERGPAQGIFVIKVRVKPKRHNTLGMQRAAMPRAASACTGAPIKVCDVRSYPRTFPKKDKNGEIVA